jgi:endonuclease/exonuclease/phosphatase family metal-dependent hydrolase
MASPGGGEERLRVVSWNVQTFFDARKDGCEYGDFVKDKSWGEAAYRERLERLCACIVALDADVLVLVEVESEAVLQDISNFLCASWLFNRQYRWAAFSKEAGGALGCAVLSRFPLDGVSCHGLDARSPRFQKKPGLRPLMQLRVVKNGRPLVLLVNHWKSMSGGKEESEPWRDAQEAVLGACLKGLGPMPALACGDFNRDVLDFVLEDGMVVLRSGGGETAVATPWFDGTGELAGPGSYWYKEEWSRIDSFFSSGRIALDDFKAETGGPWCYEDSKVPKKYKVWNGRGYSDHLPISCTVRF